MAYQNGTATTSTDLLQQLVTFLVANGWTQDRSQTEGAGWTATLHKSGNYAHLRARVNEAVFVTHQAGTSYGIDLYLGTGYLSANSFNSQTIGSPVASGGVQMVGAAMYLSAGPFTNYYFMTDSAADNVVVVVERTPGLFVHMGWGLSLNKAGAYTGGAYFFGSSSGYFGTVAGPPVNWPGYTTTAVCPGVSVDVGGCPCTYVRADVDSFTSKWISVSNNGTGAQGFTGKTGDSSLLPPTGSPNANIPVYFLGGGSAAEFQFSQTSQQDGRANLLPVLLWVNRDGTSTGFSLLGSLPMVFYSNGVGNGFSNATEYAIGADTYKMFPNFAVLKVV